MESIRLVFFRASCFFGKWSDSASRETKHYGLGCYRGRTAMMRIPRHDQNDEFCIFRFGAFQPKSDSFATVTGRVNIPTYSQEIGKQQKHLRGETTHHFPVLLATTNKDAHCSS